MAKVNAELGDTYHVEALGGNALRNWIRQNNLIEMNGGYWQNTMLPNGQQAMVRVQPPQRVIEADAENEAETAQLVYRNLDVAQLAIVKMVLFNPECFCFSWAKSKVLLMLDKDFGDFVIRYSP